MRLESLRGALQELRLIDGLSDCQLLYRFIDGRDEAAFAALVRRHGPMVMGVCRRMLGNEADAEDAFQATFLVLARRAGSVVRREAVGAFLYGVAYRTAVRAREKGARRRAVETQVKSLPHPEVPPAVAIDWRPILDRELSVLQDKYRAALLLCDLEGRTRREAARVLSVPEGTVASRLATARRMLARRLSQCGVTLPTATLAVVLAEDASAAVPVRLVAATATAAALVTAGAAVPMAAPAVVLMNDVLRSMLMNKLKTCVGVALAVALIVGVGVAHRAAGQAPGSGLRSQVQMSEARPATELDLLRREVEILKLQMQLLQDKQRIQDTELRALLKGQDGATGARLASTLRGSTYTSSGPANPAVQAPKGPDGTPPAARGGSAYPAGPYVQVPGGSPMLPPSATMPDKVAPPDSPLGMLRGTDPSTPEGERSHAAGQQDPVRFLPFVGRFFTPESRAKPEPPSGTSMAGPMVPAGSMQMAADRMRHAADQDLDAAVTAFRNWLRNAPNDAAKQRTLDMMFKAMKELSQPGEPGGPPKR